MIKMKNAIAYLLSIFMIFNALSIGNIVVADSNSEYRELISNIDINLPYLLEVKSEANNGNYEEAVRILLDYYKFRTAPVWSEMPRDSYVNSSFNTSEADRIKSCEFAFEDTYISVLNKDGSINWNLEPEGQKEWKWAFNRQFQFVTLSRAYLNTSDKSYAEAFEKQFNDWYENNPVPTNLDTNGTWRTLETGIRLSSSMISYFNNFVRSDDISLQTKARILLSMHDHGEYLLKYSGTNNWLILESKGYYSLVYMFPEFKNTNAYKQKIFDRLESVFSSQFLSDGWQYELTPNYHIEVVKSISSLQDMISKNGDELPFSGSLLDAYNSARYIKGAGNYILPLNDTHDVSESDFLVSGVDLAEKTNSELTDGFIFSASNGLYGKNDLVSKDFNKSGYITMRDNNPNGIFAFFEAGPSGFSNHGWMTRDKLQFTLSAFDRDLLIDSGGSTTYGSDALSVYSSTTPAHNTVTIDGYDQVRRDRDSFDSNDYVFKSSDKLDYAMGVYNEKYDETRKINVTHKRSIAFVKRGYFVIEDELTGNGNHTARQYWNFAPGKYSFDSSNGVVHTDFEDGKNVLVIPVNYEASERNIGSTSPTLGFTSTGSETLNLCYRKTFTDNTKMKTVIVPYEGDIAPNVTVSEVGDKLIVEYNAVADSIQFEDNNAIVLTDDKDGNSYALDYSEKQIPNNNDFFPIIPCSGTVQAEWTGLFGKDISYHYDSSAEEYFDVQLISGACQRINTEYGMNSIKIKAKGNGVLLVNDEEITVSSDEFTDYAIYDISGGCIDISCISGNVYIDKYVLTGTSDTINLKELRQRISTRASINLGKFYSNTDFSADFAARSSLSAINASEFGASFGDIKVNYSFTNNKLTVSNGSSCLFEKEYYLAYNKKYRFDVKAVGTTFKLSIDGNEITSCSILMQNGDILIFGNYIDLAVDNLSVLGKAYDFENIRIGTKPANMSVIDGQWYVEGIENQYSEMKLICSKIDVQPGDAVNLQMNNASGAKLYINGSEVKYSCCEYSFVANKGRYTCVLVMPNKVSNVVEIKSAENSYTESLFFQESFGSAISSKWMYNSERFVKSDGGWYIKGISGVQSEVFCNVTWSFGNIASFECDFVPDSENTNINLFHLRDESSKEATLILLSKDGTIRSGISTGEILGAYSAGSNNHLKAIVDFENKVYSIYNNGVLIGSNIPISISSNLKKFYPTIIWSGASGGKISNLVINKLTKNNGGNYEIQINNTVGEAKNTFIFNANQETLLLGEYKNGVLSGVNKFTSGANLTEGCYRLFDWNEKMKPNGYSIDFGIDNTPGFFYKEYFRQSFDSYLGGAPSSRWANSDGRCEAFDGGMKVIGSTSDVSEVCYHLLNQQGGKISISADFTPLGYGSADRYIFSFRDTSGHECLLFKLSRDGYIYDIGTGKRICRYNAQVKINIRAEIDLESHNYVIWIDDEKMPEIFDFNLASVGVWRIYLAKIFKGGSDILIDNFSVEIMEG